MPDDTLLTELLRQFESYAAQDILDRTTLCLTVDLLRFCRAHEPQARRSTPGIPAGWQEAFTTDVAGEITAALAASGFSSYLSEADLDAISSIVADAVGSAAEDRRDLATVLAAHALALAADTAHHERWQVQWRRDLTHEVRHGEPHPVHPQDPRRWVTPHSANSRPESHPTTPLDVLPHLRLGSDVADLFRVTVNYDLWGHAAPLASVAELRLAACRPNLSLDDFDVVWDEVHAPPVFHNRGAVDAAQQRKRAIATVAAAGEAGAAIVVLPEYCLPWQERAAFRQELASLPNRPLLVVGGSAETEDPGSVDPVNEGWVLLNDEYEQSFLKLVPALVNGVFEGVQVRRELVVFPTEAFTVALLLCRDATSPEIMQLLAQLGVNLLVVPAFSPRTGTMMGLSASLSVLSQAFTVVAVAPAQWSAASTASVRGGAELPQPRNEAAFSGPYETAPYSYYAPPGGGDVNYDDIGAWVFDVRARTVTWASASGS